MALGAPVLKKLAEKIAPKKWLIPDRAKTLEKLKEDARQVHLLLEIRDARIPFTSANLQFQQFLKWKQHLVVFTKVDLADQQKLTEWREYFKGGNYVFVNGYCKRSVSWLMVEIKKKLEDLALMEKSKVVMVVGMPNVGKTTLVNSMHLLGRQKTQFVDKLHLGETGLQPFQTKFSYSYKVSYDPPIYAMDTASVMCPKINDLETGFKLALTGAMRDVVVGKEPLARYLLTVLNSFDVSLHSKWKAEYDAHMFVKPPLDKRVRADRKKIGNDEHAVEVKGVIAEKRLNFEGYIWHPDKMEALVDSQMGALIRLYRSYIYGPKKIGAEKTARRLLSLYRTGKLGDYTWDSVPVMATQLTIPK